MKERPLGPAVASGAIRGALAGLVVALAVSFLARSFPPATWEGILGLAGAVVLIAITLATGEAVSARIESRALSAGVRFASGAALPLAALASQASLLNVQSFSMTRSQAIVSLGVMGLGLGFGQVVAGRPSPGWIGGSSVGRIAKKALGGSFGIGLGMGLLEGSSRVTTKVFVMAIFPLFIAHAIYSLAHWMTSPLGRRVAWFLEPETPDTVFPDSPSAASIHEARVARRAVAEKAAERDPSSVNLEVALELAEDALAASREVPGLEREAAYDTSHVVSLLLALGRLPEIDKHIMFFEDPTALRAERARLEGRPAEAVAIAEAALAAAGGAEVGSSRRANAHAVLALALADLGEPGRARAHIAAATGIPAWYPRALARFDTAALQALEARL